MKRFLIGSAITLLFSTLSPIAFAGEVVAVCETRANEPNIPPFNLVQGAYQGQFYNQGISGFNTLIDGYRTSKIEAKDLVKAAIAKGRLPQETLQDQRYLNAVNSQLQGLSNQRDRS